MAQVICVVGHLLRMFVYGNLLNECLLNFEIFPWNLPILVHFWNWHHFGNCWGILIFLRPLLDPKLSDMTRSTPEIIKSIRATRRKNFSAFENFEFWSPNFSVSNFSVSEFRFCRYEIIGSWKFTFSIFANEYSNENNPIFYTIDWIIMV